MKKKLNLLGELIEDFIGVRTQQELVKRLADYMHVNFKSAAVEIAWEIGASTTVHSVTKDDNDSIYRNTGRDLNQSAFSEVLETGQALVSEVQDETDENLFIEERIAIELYATQLVILPLYDNDDINGFISFYLLEEQDLAGLSELLQHLLSTVTLVIQQISLIKKLATVSRKGYQKARQFRDSYDDIVWQGEAGKVGQIRQSLLQDCRLAAKSSTTTYIEGEQGTNKKETAEVIHRFRTFGREPFVHFDCNKIIDDKQTEILFGSKSQSGKKGYWDRAGQGTIYISNSELMLPETQEILAALTASEAKNGPQILISGELDKAVNNDVFDSEVFDLISAVVVEIPALRNSREDILLIANKTLKDLSSKLKLPMPKVDKKFTQALLANDWKGNHDELKKFLETALINSPNKNLVIPKGFIEEGGVTMIRNADNLDDSIKRNIIDALKQTRGKVYGDDGAAVLLGLNPSTLQSKIRKFGIKKKNFKKS